MYYCGYRDLADWILSGQHSTISDTAPSFALPGDQPHYAPDRPADVRHVDLRVTLDFDNTTVSGTATTSFTTLFEQVSEISFDAAELDISRVTLAGQDAPLAFWAEREKLVVRLPRAYTSSEEFAVAIDYSARPRTGLTFVKPRSGNPDLPVQAWTQGETEYHHYWFPCHDSPNDRATTSLSATVPGSFFALSNGALRDVRENPDGTKTYQWRSERPYPAYLVTLVAGEFVELRDAWRDLPVNYYVRTGREDDAHRMFDNTPRMLELYSQHFGVDYPYEKYAQIVPEEFLGAMENVSATTHSYRLLPDPRASLDFSPEPVVAHELVHQWFGDMLAVRDWSHIWLKESFATYFEAVWTEHDLGQDEFRVELRQNLESYLAADARGRRPIVYNVYHKNGFELYDRHVYEKGSLVLHMLRSLVGDEPFWRALHTYTRGHQWGEVITADFERAFEAATGRSLARFFEQWVYKAGHPEFKVTYAWDDAQKLARVGVSQTQQTSETTPLFATPVDIAFMVPASDAVTPNDADAQTTLETFRVTVDEANQTFYFPLMRRPLSVRFDQGGRLIKTLDFERPSELLRFQLRHDPDVLGRIEAAEALGKLPDARSVEALEQALAGEQFWAVRAAVAAELGKQHSEHALDALLAALDQSYRQLPAPASGERLQPSREVRSELKARRAIVAALGEFHAPEQAGLAARAAERLARIMRDGDPSYFVEAGAAIALGKTRTAGAFETLAAKVETPSWNEVLRAGVFSGLGELGDARAVDLLSGWLIDRTKPQDARMAAALGLLALANTQRVAPGEAQTRAVDALIAALEDPWEPTVRVSTEAVAAWGDVRAIPALERVAGTATGEHLVRTARLAALRLRQRRTPTDEARQLRTDLEALREENRKLRDQVTGIEARLENAK